MQDLINGREEEFKTNMHLKTGGLDYHALNKPNIHIGTGINNNLNIDKTIVEEWINMNDLETL